MAKVHLLDYVAGNVRSLVNAIEKVGYTVEWVRSPTDIEKADVSDNWLEELEKPLQFYISWPQEVIDHSLETDPSRRWPFRPLHDPILFGRLPPRNPKAY